MDPHSYEDLIKRLKVGLNVNDVLVELVKKERREEPIKDQKVIDELTDVIIDAAYRFSQENAALALQFLCSLRRISRLIEKDKSKKD